MESKKVILDEMSAKIMNEPENYENLNEIAIHSKIKIKLEDKKKKQEALDIYYKNQRQSYISNKD